MTKIKFIGKFIPIIFLTTFCFLILSACNLQYYKNQFDPIFYFESKFCLSNQGVLVEGNLNVEKDNSIKLEITSPSQIKGLTFLKSNGETSVSFKGLSLKSCDTIFPESSFIVSVFDILNGIKSKNNYNLISKDNSVSSFAGKYNSLDFELKIENGSGFIKEIKLPKENLTLNLSEHKNKT